MKQTFFLKKSHSIFLRALIYLTFLYTSFRWAQKGKFIKFLCYHNFLCLSVTNVFLNNRSTCLASCPELRYGVMSWLWTTIFVNAHKQLGPDYKWSAMDISACMWTPISGFLWMYCRWLCVYGQVSSQTKRQIFLVVYCYHGKQFNIDQISESLICIPATSLVLGSCYCNIAKQRWFQCMDSCHPWQIQIVLQALTGLHPCFMIWELSQQMWDLFWNSFSKKQKLKIHEVIYQCHKIQWILFDTIICMVWIGTSIRIPFHVLSCSIIIECVRNLSNEFSHL